MPFLLFLSVPTSGMPCGSGGRIALPICGSFVDMGHNRELPPHRLKPDQILSNPPACYV
jgi:hypothetical protein